GHLAEQYPAVARWVQGYGRIELANTRGLASWFGRWTPAGWGSRITTPRRWPRRWRHWRRASPGCLGSKGSKSGGENDAGFHLAGEQREQQAVACAECRRGQGWDAAGPAIAGGGEGHPGQPDLHRGRPLPPAGRGCGLGPGLRQADRGGGAGAIPGQPALRPAGVFSGGIGGMRVKTTYLQLFARPERVVPPPSEGLAVVHAGKPAVAYYRFRDDAVGRDYDGPSRKKLSDAELAALLHDPRLEVHVLMAEGVPAGFAELDRRIDGEIELVQFGLMPEFIGQGLGRYFLQWA